MKNILSAGLFLLIVMSLNAQEYEVAADVYNGHTHKMLKGVISDSLLKSDTSFNWFSEAQKTFTPNEDVVNTVKANKEDIGFTVFMGTWCPDSHYVIPRFFKTLDAADFDKNNVRLIAVDRTKKDKNLVSETYKITNVPTIIVTIHGKEIGRIVEYGSTGKFDTELASLINKR